jgi:hypothetical protein
VAKKKVILNTQKYNTLSMKFEDSIYFTKLNNTKKSFPFGDFYLLDRFVIAEIHEGIHFDWDMVEILITHLMDHYGEDFKVGYIPNRVNSYSIDPNHWTKINDKFNILVASAIVIYNDFSFLNATIEKQFSQKSIKRCHTLDEAIRWMLSLKEFKKVNL